ncbi:hypothetical protein B5S30_g736 [[Candida] boidinii]|nr:hypothetical protein B5S30_g736 [[Candida] boidinii]
MAMDTLDLGALVAIFLALVAYFTKGSLWAVENTHYSPTFKSASSSSSGKTRDLIETLKKTGKKAIVFYGSQTGTAEDYSYKFSKELQSRFSIPTMCCDLADYDFDKLNDIFEEIDDFCLISFFMATYGEGEPTDNANEFFEYLENECENLSNVKYTCFALGNSTYEFYNAIGKKLVEEFDKFDAKLIGKLGLGDDGKATMDEDYLSWKDELFDTLRSELNIEEKEVIYEPSIKITENNELTINDKIVSLGEPNKDYINPTTDIELKKLQFGPFNHTHPYLAPIKFSKELFNSKERNCIHAEFDLSNTNLKYSTGDHIAIWPSNSNENVFKLLEILNLSDKKNQVIDIKILDDTTNFSIPSPTTYESIFRHYLEISGPISRNLLKSILPYSPNDEIKQKTIKLSDDKTLFQKEITDNFLNFADILKNLSNGLKWEKIPIEFLIENIPHLQPRYYSISSSSLSEKQTVHITAVVENEKPNSKIDHPVTGVTTNLLWNIEIAQNKLNDEYKPFVTYDLNGPRNLFNAFKLPIHIRRSTFKLPTNPSTPIILIGPGTGIAPFRGFIREKVKQVENGVNNTGKIMLFFGCRNSNEDYLYKEEWPEYSKILNENFEMINAFSRESSKKVYVQHKMIENSAKINELLINGAFIYVCGDASRMARDVHSALVKILVDERKLSEEVATEMLKNFKVLNRYQEDVW